MTGHPDAKALGQEDPKRSAPVILRRGDRSPAVTAIREQLARSGVSMSYLAPAEVENPELFDDHVDAAVRTFQQQRGLLTDGVIGPQTIRVLDGAHWRLGDRILRYDPVRELQGDDVVELQERLRSFGVFTEHLDGKLGPGTEAALKEPQRQLGLLPDGVCGPATLRGISQLGRAITGGNPLALQEAERVLNAGSSLSGKVIVVQYGGEDPVSVNGIEEQEITRDIARHLGGRLTAVGAAAVVTEYIPDGPGGRRSEDEPIGTDTGSIRLAEEMVADLYICIRCDASASPVSSGTATFYYGKSEESADVSPVGARLASLIQREIIARTDLVDCKTHARSWEVLRRASMPAVQAYVGYLSNPGDARRLMDPAFRDTLAEALLVAIQRLYLPDEADHPTGTLRADQILAYARSARF